jgi:ribonucleoside-diphosphate reductase alpha chain
METETNGFVQVVDGSHSKPPEATRHRLPTSRKSINHKFNIGTERFYVIVGLYPDGSPGELFIYTRQSGSTMKGLLDTWAITTSMALQHGVPLKAITDKLSFTRFEPSANMGEEFGFATSVIDYIVRWMAKRFLNIDYRGART